MDRKSATELRLVTLENVHFNRTFCYIIISCRHCVNTLEGELQAKMPQSDGMTTNKEANRLWPLSIHVFLNVETYSTVQKLVYRYRYQHTLCKCTFIAYSVPEFKTVFHSRV